MPRGSDVAAARMRTLAVGFPAQLRAGFDLGRDLASGVPRSSGSAIVAGMGGSAIAADLVRSVSDPETELALDTVRGPNLPAHVGSRTIVLLASYSGNTWETLSAYDDAGRRGASRIAIASGGELSRRAEHDHVPLLVVPEGIPPRSALGYMLGGLLGLLDAFFPESNERRIARTAEHLERRQTEFASATGPPARLARRTGARLPYVYASSEVSSVARRWATQIEENAKRLAHADMLPELLHNAIIAWDAVSRAHAPRASVILLDPIGAAGAASAGAQYLDRLLHRRGILVDRVRFPDEDRLVAIAEAVSFGDHFSLFLAHGAQVDPMEVRAIDRMKRTLRTPG
ncbi:MAG: hypothetical protein L3J93_03650 [Thermoplasmata archaeon]|nr:hypothetical protein [Thermoplasmata archaeon]